MKSWWKTLPWWVKANNADPLIIGLVVGWPWSLRGINRWDAVEQQWADSIGLGINSGEGK